MYKNIESCENINICIKRKTMEDRKEFINCEKNKCYYYDNYKRYGEGYNSLGIGGLL